MSFRDAFASFGQAAHLAVRAAGELSAATGDAARSGAEATARKSRTVALAAGRAMTGRRARRTAEIAGRAAVAALTTVTVTAVAGPIVGPIAGALAAAATGRSSRENESDDNAQRPGSDQSQVA